MMSNILSWDTTVFHWINEGWSTVLLDYILIPWRNSKVWIPLYVFLVTFFIFNYGKRAYWVILFLLLVVTSSDMISSRLIKPLVMRDRPCHEEANMAITNRVPCGAAYSFPSSHATNHFAIGIFLSLLFNQIWRPARWLFTLWAFIVGVAQVYVGVHFPIDVIFGGILGSAIGYGWFSLWQKYYGPLEMSV